MTVTSVFDQLERLLPQVSKPIQYVGGELGSVVKDWDTADRALGADVPGRVRGRPAQPGRPDPVRGAQRAARRAGRADLRGLAGPRGADARARCAAVHRRRAPAGARVRPVRHLVLHRARLHQHADRARPGRHPAAAPGTAPTTTRSCSPAGTPRSTRSRSRTSSTPRCSATARRRSARSPRSCGTGRTRAARAAGTSCCCGWPVPRRSTCPASTTWTTCPTAGSSGSCRTGPTCRSASTSAPRWTSTRGRTRASRWCRWPRRCTSGTRWRSSAAAPGAAGSARPA